MLFLFVLRHLCRYTCEIVMCLCGAALFFFFICKVYVDLRSATCSEYSCTLSASQSFIVQELCESRGGRPGLSVLTSLLASVDVKNY